MLKLHQQFRSRYRFLLTLCLLILLSLLFQGQLTAKIEREKSRVEEQNKELRQINKGQKDQLEKLDDRIKNLEKEVKDIKIAKAKQAAIFYASVPYYSPPQANQKEILSLVYNIWWEDSRFHQLIVCESNYNNWADGYDEAYDQHNYGIFQVSDGHGFSQEQLANPTFNITKAKQIWDERKADRGLWWAWRAWPTCSTEAGFI